MKSMTSQFRLVSLRQETTGIELGEIPFYGTKGSSALASRLRQRFGG